MPFTAAQLASGANYALDAYQKKEPIDQINFQHKTLDWLIKNKEESSFGNGAFREPLHVDNGSNYQNYFGADQVTYNERDPSLWTSFPWYNIHDGFWFDEDRLLAAGIHIGDGGEAPTRAEKEALNNLLKQSYRGLKDGMQENLAYDLLRDGSQSTKACPGLASIVDPSPSTGTVGGLNAATYTWWRNNANLTVTAADIVEEMEESLAAVIRYGGRMPTFIPCGRAFYDNFLEVSASKVQRHIAMQQKGGTALDPSITGANFHGIPLVWDPTFEALDTLLGTSTQTKTAYLLNEQDIKLRPVKGEWMKDRKPERLPDRYVHYFGRTAKFSLTTAKRRGLAVVSIA